MASVAGQVTSAFATATAVEAAGDGVWRATCDTAWSAPNGPNGGYLAAIVLRAMAAELDDPARPARSLTCHYLRPPTDGELRIALSVERAGRSVTVLSARVHQLTHPAGACVVALGAFAVDRAAVADYAPSAPEVRPAREVPVAAVPDAAPAIAHRFAVRPAIGAPPFSGASAAVSGGWIRFADPHPVDAAALAMYADAWLPAPFARLTAPVAAPTIDLTVHFRATGPAAALSAAEPILAVFNSTTSAEGFFEEDGQLWSPDGVLLAHSRQLALLVEPGR
ncbi:MAG: thioesterase family protein [Actinomycetota bacterium]|nr:thioesterase family protein [Actinomycetota bacterium]